MARLWRRNGLKASCSVSKLSDIPMKNGADMINAQLRRVTPERNMSGS